MKYGTLHLNDLDMQWILILLVGYFLSNGWRFKLNFFGVRIEDDGSNYRWVLFGAFVWRLFRLLVRRSLLVWQDMRKWQDIGSKMASTGPLEVPFDSIIPPDKSLILRIFKVFLAFGALQTWDDIVAFVCFLVGFLFGNGGQRIWQPKWGGRRWGGFWQLLATFDAVLWYDTSSSTKNATRVAEAPRRRPAYTIKLTDTEPQVLGWFRGPMHGDGVCEEWRGDRYTLMYDRHTFIAEDGSRVSFLRDREQDAEDEHLMRILKVLASDEGQKGIVYSSAVLSAALAFRNTLPFITSGEAEGDQPAHIVRILVGTGIMTVLAAVAYVSSERYSGTHFLDATTERGVILRLEQDIMILRVMRYGEHPDKCSKLQILRRQFDEGRDGRFFESTELTAEEIDSRIADDNKYPRFTWEMVPSECQESQSVSERNNDYASDGL